PTTCRPLLPYLFWNSMNHGISTLHGPHQVAQKSSRITLPLNVDRRTLLLSMSLSVKFRFALFASAGHADPSGGPSACRNGRSTGRVSSASASAPIVAAPHRSVWVMGVILPDRGPHERRDARHFLLRLARDHDKRPVVGAPDRRLVAENLNDLRRPLGLRQHEQRDGLAAMTVHDV